VLAACIFLAGCGGESSTSELPDETLSPDEQVIKALEPYDPVYRVNSSGRVVSLKLEGWRIPASVLDEAGKLTELKDLSLYAALLTDDSLAKLQNLKKLQSLGLGATPITERGLAHLEGLLALRWIWLSKELVPSAGVDRLSAAIPGLTVYPQ
jgi:hypothetical protein